jgi:hypothetical protein
MPRQPKRQTPGATRNIDQTSVFQRGKNQVFLIFAIRPAIDSGCPISFLCTRTARISKRAMAEPTARPIPIFGGCYSNLQATRAMLGIAERPGFQPCDVICTEDIVAYCADPPATVDLIRACGIRVVIGNWEDALAAAADNCCCGFEEGRMRLSVAAATRCRSGGRAPRNLPALYAHPPISRTFGVRANSAPLAVGGSAPRQHGAAT